MRIQAYLFAAVLGCSIQQVNAAWITGQIKNAEPDSKISLVIPHYYLDGKSTNLHSTLDLQSQFAFEATLREGGLAFLEFNDERLAFYLGPSDTLSIKADAFQFPVVAHFSGRNGSNNRLYQAFLKQHQLDFNEFNNIRFKIGQTWITVESAVNSLMESLTPELFRSSIDAQRDAAVALIDDFVLKNPDALSADFLSWLQAEYTYAWAYHLLVYGQVYAYRYDIQPAFFDFLFEAPIISDELGSTWYRQFLIAFMARQQIKSAPNEPFWAGQYQLAERLLSGKSLAFFRSELLTTAFSAERFTELLPLYSHFLEKNPFPDFDDKVEGLYQKYARVFPGSAAPAFEATDLQGETISLRQFAGKVLYLNFWASWCGACVRKMDFFNEFAPALNANGIEIVNISIDDQPERWQAAIKEYQPAGRHLLAASGKNGHLARLFGVEAIPQYFIVGKTGLFESKPASSQPNDIYLKLLEISVKGR